MENCKRSGVVLIMYFPIAVIAIFAIGRSEGRELRPSRHGLGTAAGGEESPEMRSFFGGKAAPPSPQVIMPFPEAKNMSDASWWKEVSGGGQRDRARESLVVVAAVCGGVGVTFLAVAGLIFVVRRRRQSCSGRPK